MRGQIWWVDRWRQSSARTSLGLSERAIYRELLDEVWLREQPLPNDDTVLARIALATPREWARAKAKVLANFGRMGGTTRPPRS